MYTIKNALYPDLLSNARSQSWYDITNSPNLFKMEGP